MRIKTLKLENFRGYKDEVLVEFGDLTTFVGKNDIGKSSIMEALDIFFNDGDGVVKLDKDDINKEALKEDNKDIFITVCFDNLPEKVVLDATNETTLGDEYLLNSYGQLEIIKKYSNAGKAKVFIKSNHPTNDECKDLLQKKDTELRTIIDSKGISCDDKTKNAVMRKAIWNHYKDNLQVSEVALDVTKGDTKSIWDKLQNYLPIYTLFQSDRKNSDGDNEVQDPLKNAVTQILNDTALREKCNEIASVVENRLKEVSERTLSKLREMNPNVANSLNPVIPQAESLKWGDVFKKVSISGDDDIPINKRGSGIKRLILLNFFRAEAERRMSEQDSNSIIYAIEEPETSQHTEHQKILINSFLDLSKDSNTQIIMTTHSANIVKQLKFEHLRLISKHNDVKEITHIVQNQLPYPSLNEVNYLAFSEVTEEYHNELYGYLEAEGLIQSYKDGKPTMSYTKVFKDGKTKVENIILTEYIRHQIHHPENRCNTRYTFEQLSESIGLMRDYIQSKINI